MFYPTNAVRHWHIIHYATSTYFVISCGFLFLFSGTSGESFSTTTNLEKDGLPVVMEDLQVHYSSHAGRVKRDLRTVRVIARTPIPEDVGSNVRLFDLASTDTSGPYTVTGDSAGIPHMFVVRNNRYLHLNSSLYAWERRKFDFEEYRMFEVYVTASTGTNATALTIQLPLSDVNDEPPQFSMEVRPFLAQVAMDAIPWTLVYDLTASDADGDPDLEMKLVEVEPKEYSSRFKLQLDSYRPSSVTSSIVISGSSALPSSQEITIYVTVEDRNAEGGPQITVAQVYVLVGVRPPQFYSPDYTGYIDESIGDDVGNNRVETNENTPLAVKVVNFEPSSPVDIKLLELDGIESARFEMLPGGQIHNIQVLDFETTKSVTLTLEATSRKSGRNSTSNLHILIRDENDNGPEFSKDNYLKTVREDESVDSVILEVDAFDLDSGNNGEIEFSLPNNDDFYVETAKGTKLNTYLGRIKIKRPLDYDDLHNVPVLTFTIIAADKGVPARSATAHAIVTLENVNDNKPNITFDGSVNGAVDMYDTTTPGSVVTVVLAWDADWDGVQFSFNDGSLRQDIFSIDKTTGVIRTTGNVNSALDHYELTIVAADDGSCCEGGTSLTSNSTLTVNIVDINSNKPEFENCSSYDMSASILDKAAVGTYVIKVLASDKDRGENGRVIYEIDEENSPFGINSTTGVITVKEELNRNDKGYEQVTVKGRNPGLVPLMMSWCSFRVKVDDLNNHSPQFSEKDYYADVLQSASIGEWIVDMPATDADKGDNGRVTYEMLPRSDPTFTIDESTGTVSLQYRIDQAVSSTYQYDITARDHGKYPYSKNTTARLTITVVRQKTSSLSWIDRPTQNEFSVDETAGPNHVITNVTCHSNYPDPRVSFFVYENSIIYDSDKFGVQPIPGNNNTVNLVTINNRLDYRTKKKYIIYIVCRDSDTSIKDPQLVLTINVMDTNNEVPRFVGLISKNDGYIVGSVSEDAKIETFVTYVQAVDDDTVPAFKKITFSISDNSFRVVPVSDNQARIVTNKILDRETKDKFLFTVFAKDGAPSVFNPSQHNTANRQITVDVTDVNDNPPTFNETLYSHNVSESANINDLVFSVTADDVDLVDTKLDYVFVSGNTKGAFSVFFGSGEIRIARKLDYDNMGVDKVYRMRLQASDQGGKHTATTMVEITVLDENDNPPVFAKPIYDVKDVTVTKLPQFLIQVSATDIDQHSDIRYSLLNPSRETQSLFTVDSISGDISLTGALDRPVYTVAVKAEDNRIDPLIGYAEVNVYPIDVNDKPVFEREEIEVDLVENSGPGTDVTKIQATDTDKRPDRVVRYRLATQRQPEPGGSQFFDIDTTTGLLKTKAPSSDVDRELYPRLYVIVEAYYSGTPRLSATVTVIVNLLDANDNAPRFLQDTYNISVSENDGGQVAGEPIIVEDKDVDLKNRQLVFTIIGDASGHFFVQPSFNDLGAAFIGVKSTNPVDFEKDPHVFDFTVRVTDGMATHTSNAAIRVTVTDYNDNRPVFGTGEVNVTLIDGTPPSSPVTQLHATDADETINGEIVYSILRESDPRYEFYVDPDSGTVTTRKVLDREKDPVMRIVVAATDKGQIPQSSSAIIMITLTDANDWAPQFKEMYLPKVEENVPNRNTRVVEIFAIDKDTLPFGPPFGFKLPPHCTSLACKRFQLEFDKDGDGGNGTAIITTSATFDREVQKDYHLPIVTWDMRDNKDPSVSSLTATNTLTIVIGDANDNPHFPGHQDIRAYSYRGTKGPKEIGRVFTKDLDDWDLPDKTFTAKMSTIMQEYFSVASDTGMITMFENVPPNKNQSFSTYDFNVRVYDKKFDKTVTCSVSVTVDEMTDEAVWKSGSIRLTGVTAEEFIFNIETPNSKYNLFRHQLASILGYADSSHVEIVSIQESGTALDIRFSGHGSPYLNPAQMESAVMLHQKDFESSLGVKIEMLPINLCMEEVYDVGCSMKLTVTEDPNLVNSNGSSYVGVKVTFVAVPDCLDCSFPTPDRCNGGYCYNGGTCHQDDWGKITCQCQPGFDGPRCQQRRHHFNGTSLAFYHGLSVCVDGRTMLDFITLEEDGLIMYAAGSLAKDQKDKFIFDLKSGYPRLRINLGAGERVLTLNGLDQSGTLRMNKLNDGKWHHVDIDKKGQHIQLTVDRCQIAEVTSPEGIIRDWSPCRVSGSVPGPDILLNTPGFLYVGGPYPRDSVLGIPSKGFSGCLKNLVHNSKLYDLSYKQIPAWNSGTANCPREDRTCQNGLTCGQRADCVSEWRPSDRVVECSCHAGWGGERCEEESPIKDFGSASFLKWELDQKILQDSVRVHRLSLMFRTRQDTGTLFSMSNDQLNVIMIQLRAGKLVVSYNMGGEDDETVVLDKTRAATGQWHTLRLERYGHELSIGMDNGEGRTYARDVGGLGDAAVVVFKSLSFVSSGARISHVIQDRVGNADFKDDDLVDTCIRDVRYNDVSLPMNMPVGSGDGGGGWDARLVDSRNVTDGCTRQDCLVPDLCGPGTVCHPLWEEHVCRPPPGVVVVCGSHACYNGGVCVTVNDVTSCRCVYPWVGASCNVSVAVGKVVEDDDGTLAAGAIAGIVVGALFLIILLIFLVLLIAFWLRRGEKDRLVRELDGEHACDNIMYYDEEGAGEKDCDGYSMSHLQQPRLTPPPRRIVGEVDTIRPAIATAVTATRAGAPSPPRPSIGQFIDDRLNRPDTNYDDDTNPDQDQLRHYAYEGSGTGSSAGSLSSIQSGTGSDVSQEYDYLGGWGPKFSRLADMYGAAGDTDTELAI